MCINISICQTLAPELTIFNGDLTNSGFTINDPDANIGGTISLTNGIKFNNIIGGHECRVFKNIGLLNDNNFNASCDLNLTTGYTPGHVAMAFTSGQLDIVTDATGVNCYGGSTETSNCTYTPTDQSAIEIVIMNNNGYIETSGVSIYVYSKLPKVTHVLASTPIDIPANQIGNVNIVFVRTSLTSGTIKCINKTTGLQIGQSTVVIPATLVNLNTFQSGVVTPANNERSLTGTVNNINIVNCKNTSVIEGESEICKNQTINLSSLSPNGVWKSSNTSIATVDVTGNVTGISEGIDTITYTVTSGFCSSTVSKAITVSNVVSNFSIHGNTSNCPGTTATYTISPTLNNTRYYWVVDSGINISHLNNQSSQIVVNFPDKPGTNYTLKVIAMNSCSNAKEVSLPISITSDLPNKPKMICSGNNNCATLNLQTGPSLGESVSWNNGGTIIENVTSITRAIDKQVYVTFSKNGCSYSDAYIPQICIDGTPTTSGISNPTINNNFALYPNPNNGIFSFETKGGIGKAFVINSLGVILFDMSLEESKTKYDVNLSNLSSGVYILKVSEGDNSNSTSFIVK